MAEETKPKTKICKYCKSEIPADAKICPHCRKRQSGGKLKWIIIAFVVICIIAAASGGGDKPEKVASSTAETDSSASEAMTTAPSTSDAASTTAQTESTAEAESTTDAESADDTFTIGDTVEYDGIQVTLSAAILSNGDGQFITPDDGKYFLGLIFDINNQSSSDISISSIMSFEAYCDDYSLNLDLTGYQAPEFDELSQIDGSVAAGKRMNGVICYQVPKDFSTFEISCTPDFWGNNKVTFKFNKDEVDSSAISQ